MTSFSRPTSGISAAIRLVLATLLILLPSLALAHTFNIPSGDIPALKAAIATANSNNQDDIFEFSTNAVYTLTEVDPTFSGGNGLPPITGDTGNRKVLIHGNGATLQRSNASGTPGFRIFYVASGSNVTMTRLTIANGNTSGNGAGILNDHGRLTVQDCAFSGNAAGDGAAIFSTGFDGSARLDVSNSTFDENTALFGGAIYQLGGTASSGVMTIANSTFHHNGAESKGGAIYNDDGGGSSVLRILNCTFADNAAASGDSIYDDASEIQIGNTLLKNGGGINIFNSGGLISSFGYNLANDSGEQTGTAFNRPGDQLNTDPRFDPAGLTNNGGPTATIALAFGSPAIDQGKDLAATGKDQRGLKRPILQQGTTPASGGDFSDIGAFESPVLMLDSHFVSQQVPTTMFPGQTYPVSIRVQNTGTTTWTFPSRYKLASTNAHNNLTWGINRVRLPFSGSVPPGIAITFDFNVTAPGTPGAYNFQWRMLQELIARFGPSSPNVVIDVVAPSTAVNGD